MCVCVSVTLGARPCVCLHVAACPRVCTYVRVCPCVRDVSVGLRVLVSPRAHPCTCAGSGEGLSWSVVGDTGCVVWRGVML